MSKQFIAANRILDLVRSGDKSISLKTINWALRVTGDLIGNRL